MYTEHLNTLVSFIRDQKSENKILHNYLFTEDDLYFVRNNSDCVEQLVSLACKLNRRIHSQAISEAIEEVAAIWEVSR